MQFSLNLHIYSFSKNDTFALMSVILHYLLGVLFTLFQRVVDLN